MQPAVAEGCGGGNGDRQGHPSGHGNEIAGVYVDAQVTEDVLGKGLLPVGGTPTGAYAEVQEDGDHTPVNVEAGTAHSKGHTYTCSDTVIDFLEDELP